jgi:hypothetical protein
MAQKRKHSEWHLKVLKALPRILSNSMDTYFNLRSAGYVYWGGDGEVEITSEGRKCVRTGVCLMPPY